MRRRLRTLSLHLSSLAAWKTIATETAIMIHGMSTGTSSALDSCMDGTRRRINAGRETKMTTVVRPSARFSGIPARGIRRDATPRVRPIRRKNAI